MATDDLEATAFSHASDHVDIYSNSWGPQDVGFTIRGPGRLAQLALKNGAEKVRNVVIKF